MTSKSPRQHSLGFPIRSEGPARSQTPEKSAAVNWARARRAVLQEVSEARAQQPSAWDVAYQKLTRARPAVQPNEAERFVREVAAVRWTGSSRGTPVLPPPAGGGKGKGKAVDLKPGSKTGSSQLSALQQLSAILERHRHLGALPNATIVLSELSVPFLNSSLDIEACNFALNLFRTMCLYFRAISPEEELARWMWCVRAVECANGQIRSRALSQLNALLFPPPGSAASARPDTPMALQALVVGLIRALHATTKTLQHGDESQSRDFAAIEALLQKTAAGQIIQPLPLQGDNYSIRDHQMERSDVARLAFLEGIVRAIAAGPSSLSAFAITNLLNNAWLSPSRIPHITLLRLLSQLAAAFSSLLRVHSVEQGGVMIGRLLENALTTAALDFLRAHFRLSALQSLPQDVQQAVLTCYLCFIEGIGSDQALNQQWPPPPQLDVPVHINEVRETLHAAWKLGMHAQMAAAALECIRTDLSITKIGFLCLATHKTMANSLAQTLLPPLQQKLSSATLNATERSQMAELLSALASRHPQLFYKPLFGCAAANKEDGVRSNLQVIRSLADLMNPLRFYFRDAEMMSIALFSSTDPARSEKGAQWSTLRLGQQALLAELIAYLQGLRAANLQVVEAREVRLFADAFDARVERILSTREASTVLALADRMLTCSLLLELQLISASQKKPPWFDRVVRWTCSAHVGAKVALDPKTSTNPFIQDAPLSRVLTADDALEAEDALRFLSHISVTEEAEGEALPSHPAQSSGKLLLGMAGRGTAAPMLSTVAALHAGLNDEDLAEICGTIWQHNLLGVGANDLVSAAFLLMQGGDRIPEALTKLVDADINHSDGSVRYSAIQKLATLFASRFDVLSQPLPDKLRKRPFRAIRQQVAFVPTNMGLSSYVLPPLVEVTRATVATSLPNEIRKALAELGWDQESSQQTASERERMPLRVLPLADVLPDTAHPETSTKPEPGTSTLLRRKSSASSAKGTGTRPIVVVGVATLLLRLLVLANDPDTHVANTANEALTLFIRDEPLLVLRPVLEGLSGSPAEQALAVTQLSKICLLHSQLPPSYANQAFNHLAGLIRMVIREEDPSRALAGLARSIAVTCALASRVPDVSIREIKKSKAESFFLPTGQLWFADPDPLAAGFPRSYRGDPSTFERLDMPASVYAVIATRVAQNRFVAALMDGRTDQEAFFRIKQGLKPFALPINDAPKALVDNEYLPVVPTSNALRRVSRRRQDFYAFSRMLARSHLQMIFSLIGGLNRHLSDRSELAKVLDGPLRALLIHGAFDVDIALLAIRCCLLASIRFHRLFSSGGGFGVMVPALFKVYCDTEVPAIRGAVEGACIAFYARHEHQESFVFQCLSALASIIATPDVPSAVADVARTKLFGLLRALDAGLPTSGEDLLAGTMHQAEREAAIHRFNDAPEAILAPFMKRHDEETPKTVAVASIKSTFPLEDSIRLFITAITFEPASKRSVSFLRLLRLLVPPFLQHSAATRGLLRDGVEALVDTFVRSSPPVRTKALGGIVTEAAAPLDAAQQLAWVSAREAYLFLCEAYLKAGGELAPPTIRKLLDMLKTLLRSAGASVHSAASDVVAKSSSILLSGSASHKAVNGFLQDFAHIFREFAPAVGFAPFLEGLDDIVARRGRELGLVFMQNVVAEYVAPAVSIILAAPTSSATLLALKNATVDLVASLAEAGFEDTLGPLEAQKSTSSLLARLLIPLIGRLASHRPDLLSPLQDDTLRGRLHLRLATLLVKTMQENRSATVLLLSCQALKTIAISSDKSLSTVAGAWPLIAGALRSRLALGGVAFLTAFPTSPTASAGGRHGHSPSFDVRGSTPAPQAVDYAFWSLAELLNLTANPLMIYLRITLREKVAEARNCVSQGDRPPRLDRRSFTPASPILQRSASRGHVLQRSLSPASSPKGSPRRASFAIYERAYRPVEPSSAPSSPLQADSSMPRIQHLGLMEPTSNAETTENQALRSKKLERLTLQRIRRVQLLLGEAPITHPLAMPNEDEDEELGLRAWTHHEALKRIDDETALLVAELG